MYALVFLDAGLTPAQVSLLFVIWSASAFLLEVPSGAWADVVDRRTLLFASGIVHAAGFAVWMAWPGFTGFALGFVLWSASSALVSGTFEALVYDELSAIGRADAYARVVGWSHSCALLANLAATVAAAPLHAIGGYGLVGWTSVVIAVGQAGLALLLPRARRVELADETRDAAAGRSLARRYASMLRDGTREAARRPRVRHLVLVTAAMLGLMAYDEYFPVLLRESGAETGRVPLLLAVIVLAQAMGTALAGRTQTMSAGVMAAALALGVCGISVGAATGGTAGLMLLAVGYGVVSNLVVVCEARLQHAIETRARATVTSVAGLASEVFGISVYAFAAVGSLWWPMTVVVAAFGAPALLLAVLVARWLPPAHDPPPDPPAVPS